MLTGKKLLKAFAGHTVLRDINVEVSPGQITAVIGPSGGGKTTLLRALSMLDPPDAGEVMVDDRLYRFPVPDAEAIQPPWPELTVVFQQLFLWPHLTLRQNITLPLDGGRREAGSEKLVHELIEAFDMNDFIDRYPNEVSLGQRQRAALARALALQPRYLLLDEITSALDVEQVGAVLDYLRLLKNRGRGILIVTHLLGFAENTADRIIFLDKGRVVESGGRDILINPSSGRVQEFLSVVRAAK